MYSKQRVFYSVFGDWKSQPTAFDYDRTSVQCLFVSILTCKALRKARGNEGSHSFTCHTHAYTRME